MATITQASDSMSLWGARGRPPDRRQVLLIEDNPGDVRLIGEMLQEAGPYRFDLTVADRLSTGLDCLGTNGLHLVLLDLGLPDSQGLNTFARVYARATHLPIVILTGLADEKLALKAMEMGDQDYLVKGQLDGSLLVRAMRYAMERKHAEAALRSLAQKWQTTFDAIGDAVFLLDREGRIQQCNQAMTELVGRSFPEIIGNLYWRVVHGATAPVDGCPFSRMQLSRKRETLTFEQDDQWLYAMADPILGENGDVIAFPWPVGQIVLQHHERLDGSGYPHGLKAEDILLEACILAVADVVEAMASHRPYRPALGIEVALAEITQNRGKLYEPRAVDACVKLFIEHGYEIR